VNKHEIKQCSLNFKQSPAEEDRKKIIEYLESLDLLENISLIDTHLSFDYPFPLVTISIMKSQLQTEFPAHPITMQFLTSLYAYMENNERDYIVFQPGWSRYVEDIYIHYFDQRHGGKRDVKNMLWRKYKKKRIEVTS
jgi:hypothetical protein